MQQILKCWQNYCKRYRKCKIKGWSFPDNPCLKAVCGIIGMCIRLIATYFQDNYAI